MSLVGERRGDAYGLGASHYADGAVHSRTGLIVYVRAVPVVAQAESRSEAAAEQKRCLMEETEIESGSVEDPGDIIHVGIDTHSPSPLYGSGGSLLCGLVGHTLTYEPLCEGVEHGGIHRLADVLGKETVHVTVEIYRSIGMQPLLAAKNACCPSPHPPVVVFQHQLLRYRVLPLAFCHKHEVLRHIVDVHGHEVVEMLVGGGGDEAHVAELEASLDGSVEYVAAVLAVVVCRGVGQMAVGCV